MSMSGKQMMEREAQLLADLIAERDRQKQAIIASTEQCAALVRERDELQKQVWLYEQNGVTCQTYRHKIQQSCSECNVQMNYTNPPQREWVGLTDEDRLHLVDTHVGFVSPFHPLSNDDWINYASAIEAKPKEKSA